MCDPQNFNKPADKLLEKKLPFSPHFLTPAGMLLPKHQQPPPMYGPRGATVPPKFIPKYENIALQPNFRGSNRGRGAHHGPRRPFNHSEQVLPPRNWDLWCETCDRDFSSEDSLASHKAEHSTCGIDGCKFVAHPSLLQKHVQQQHESGLFDKLKNLESPEDISKWREDRRKNYPTRANIELKEKVKAAKKERGEKLDAPTNRFNRNAEKKESKRHKKNKKKREKVMNATTKKSVVQVDAAAAAEEKHVIGMFKGTKGMWDEEPPKQNPLMGLIGMYGSSDESDNEELQEEEPGCSSAVVLNSQSQPLDGRLDDLLTGNSTVPGTHSLEIKQEEAECSSAVVKIKSTIAENGMADDKDAATEDVPADSPEAKSLNVKLENVNLAPAEQIAQSGKRKLTDSDALQHKIAPKERKVIKSGLNYEALKRTKPNTLLFKLLQGEIRHERNVLLQAVKYVVDKDFLDEKK